MTLSTQSEEMTQSEYESQMQELYDWSDIHETNMLGAEDISQGYWQECHDKYYRTEQNITDLHEYADECGLKRY